ncbi:hypothetical protein CQW23_06481 [Capsicum baccatum]|uniref:Ubiquitin-like protease family profile domain-containing protein n=1 Tax=Capsicum baccatum TaxID=33114 RepID=A0A2G2X3L1_CAPBA|nr:hypothetical protein CQW23_06481 [Capsicum baccatum]
MAELVTLISKIPAEVVKALKNEENKQPQDVYAADKDAGRDDNFENKDCSDLQALEDEVDGTITDSIQSVVDTILFGLSTPSTTKSLDISASNKMNERHLNLPDSQIPPDFRDAQFRELQAAKAKAPAKRERKKSRILRSPYISKYGSGSKDAIDFDKEEKMKYAFDGYNINQELPNELMIDYSQWIAVGLLKTHSAKKETDNHYQVNASGLAELAVDLSTPQYYAESIVVAKNEDVIANIIQGFCMPVGLPWYMVDEVYVSINYGKEFYWILAVIVLKKRDCGVFVCAYAEILSEGLQVHSCGFDDACQRARNASLLWHYGVEKANEGYTSNNGDPPRPRKSVIEEIEANAIVTVE